MGPPMCKHGKTTGNCGACLDALIADLDFGGDRTLERDDRNDLRRHPTAQFHVNREPK